MEFLTKTKTVFLLLSAFSLTVADRFLGGLDISIKVLFFMMVADYVTGFMVAVAKKSLKTETGGLSSKIGFIGLAKKVFIIFCVATAVCLDKLLGVDFIRTYTIYTFVANEILSFLENAGLWGVPVPEPIKQALDILQKGGEKS